MVSTIEEEIKIVVKRVKKSLGDDSSKWRWGDLHKIQFKHSLNKFDYWKELHLGPDEIGGSPTTLGMAMHMGKGLVKQRMMKFLAGFIMDLRID